jgi:hypothetical protein
MIRADCNVFYYNKSKTEAAASRPASSRPASHRPATASLTAENWQPIAFV